MKILSIDSTANTSTVALLENDKLLGIYTANTKNTHSETLLPMVETALKHYGITIDEVELFAVSAGPGSFTGVRIGVATLKGIAFGKSKPCVAVSTLEAIAENAKAREGLICPVMNARRSQVYTALFSSDGEKLTRLMPDSALSINELDELLSKYEHPVTFCGDGYGITLKALKNTTASPLPDRLRHQSAYSVAQVALRKYESGEYTNDTDLTVTYLRPSQAERERMEKENLL